VSKGTLAAEGRSRIIGGNRSNGTGETLNRSMQKRFVGRHWGKADSSRKGSKRVGYPTPKDFFEPLKITTTTEKSDMPLASSEKGVMGEGSKSSS